MSARELGLQGIFREFGLPQPTSKTATSPSNRSLQQYAGYLRKGLKQGIFARHAGNYCQDAGIEQVNRTPLARPSGPAGPVKVNWLGSGSDPAPSRLAGSSRAKSKIYFGATVRAKLCNSAILGPDGKPGI